LCKASIESFYLYSYCDKSIEISYRIYGNDTSDTDVLIGIVASVFSLIVVGLIIWLLVKTKCCTRFGAFKIKKIPDFNKAELYKDAENIKVEPLIQDIPMVLSEREPKVNIIERKEINEKNVIATNYMMGGNTNRSKQEKLFEMEAKVDTGENVIVTKKFVPVREEINLEKEANENDDNSQLVKTKTLEDIPNFTDQPKSKTKQTTSLANMKRKVKPDPPKNDDY
jgi:hypothetical protein